jgi:hypothetical protein
MGLGSEIVVPVALHHFLHRNILKSLGVATKNRSKIQIVLPRVRDVSARSRRNPQKTANSSEKEFGALV